MGDIFAVTHGKNNLAANEREFTDGCPTLRAFAKGGTRCSRIATLHAFGLVAIRRRHPHNRFTPRTPIVAATGVVFLFLSALHIYWACGGRWGAQVTVPNKGDRPLFTPSVRATVIVALLLLMAAMVLLLRINVPTNATLEFITRCGAWVLTAVFVLRATGDFHWIGFFKTVRGAGFARLDTWVYSPLCLLLAAGSAVAAKTAISR